MYQGSNSDGSKLSRTSSLICPSPEEELLEAVFADNIRKIDQVISKHKYLLTHTYPEYGKKILIIACSENAVTVDTVRELLKLGANPRDCTDEGWEALHWAAQKTDEKILKVLLDWNPGDVNVVDLYGNNALQILIRHGAKDSPTFGNCARLLIERGVNVNQTDNKNKTALDWAKKKGVYNEIQAILEDTKESRKPVLTNNNLNDGEQLLNYLKERDEAAFVDYRGGAINQWVDYEQGSTLLQICCNKGLNEAAKHLLSKGADFDRTAIKDNKKPIVKVAERGNTELFKLLLDKYQPISRIPEGLLAILCKYSDSHILSDQECFKAYVDRIEGGTPDEKSLKVNEIGNNGNSALHYVIRYGDSETAERLLNLGASLGAKNDFDVMPIQDIKPELLEKHLDSCVYFDTKSMKNEKEDFEVKFKYRSLIPPYAKNSETCKDVEAAGIALEFEKELVAETEVISFMSNTSEFKHLLKHPVIVSFLFMKWLQIQWLFWTNLSFYITFVLSLVIYIFSDYAYFTTQEKSSFQIFLSSLSYVCLLLTLLILIIREFFQICVASTKYFKNFENYIEIVLIVITSMIVFNKSPDFDSRKQLSSISILLAAFELVLMLGQHPYYSTNVVMLKTVSFNFFKFLIWYSLLIIAFAMSFYLLFKTNAVEDTRIEAKNVTADKSGDEDKSFDDPGRSVFKTIIMLTGEFDASSINFDTFPVTSKIIFALFIFMIAIILLNLLNGLAVSDTQMIKNDAELVGHVARAQHIRYVESMLMGNVLPMNVMKKISDMCCCLPISRSCSLRVAHALSRDVCLFPKYLNYELAFYPNKGGLVVFPKGQKGLKRGCGPCNVVRLDTDTTKRTNQIVQRRIEEQKRAICSRKVEQEFGDLREKIDAILKILDVPKSS
ncbi:transient receptor potential cation channel protein painless-like [Euwallacea fornicatus]|uniref:transient receptor potential cation channel protein painless-like n=1 Tax=Euwallacea fornicatus TaxID=995702 RepID=UPI00338F12C4